MWTYRFTSVHLFLSQPAPSINQFIYVMTWDGVASSIRAGSSFLCLGDFCKKVEKNRQKSSNSKVEEMQKRSIPKQFNVQEGALMPRERYSLNWSRGQALLSGFKYMKGLGFH